MPQLGSEIETDHLSYMSLERCCYASPLGYVGSHHHCRHYEEQVDDDRLTLEICCTVHIILTIKSGFGPSDKSWPNFPIVMSPTSSRLGHFSKMCFTRCIASSGVQPFFSAKWRKYSNLKQTCVKHKCKVC